MSKLRHIVEANIRHAGTANDGIVGCIGVVLCAIGNFE